MIVSFVRLFSVIRQLWGVSEWNALCGVLFHSFHMLIFAPIFCCRCWLIITVIMLPWILLQIDFTLFIATKKDRKLCRKDAGEKQHFFFCTATLHPSTYEKSNRPKCTKRKPDMQKCWRTSTASTPRERKETKEWIKLRWWHRVCDYCD